jgi:hypothetical protein
MKSRIRIRIRIKVKNKIRIRIEMMHIRNPEELGGEKERERPGSGAGWAVTEAEGGAAASLPPLFSSLLEKQDMFKHRMNI